MAVRKRMEIPVRIWHHVIERGWKEAWNYLVFRWLFCVHSPLIARIISCIAPYPCMIEIETSTCCNLKCNMCEQTYWDIPPENMPFHKFMDIMHQFPKLKWIGLTGIGESLLNPEFLTMCRYVKLGGTYLEVFDNMTLWDKDVSRAMVNMGLNRLQPSIDGARKRTYESIRVGADFDVVVKNLHDLFLEKERQRSWFPEVSVHYIVQKSNVEEMPEFVSLIRFLARDQPVWVQFTQILTPFEEAKELVCAVPDRIRDRCEVVAKAARVNLIWNYNTAENKPPLKTCTLWTMPFIFVNGDVMPCCGGNEANNREAQMLTRLGNIFDTPFKEIWQGGRYRDLRAMLRGNWCPIQCVNCPTFGRKGE